ncbi:MAG TPA: 4a-hydroxytetrahydrobiopterin dehydratase [Thermoanaerobaculia bacterium]|nr:4a-hydroxytetrahydrobiopterin dehydratase [Thermoanaerobaculia bacterium]
MSTPDTSDKTQPDLASRSCGPCKAGTPPVAGEQLAKLLTQLDGWSAEAAPDGSRRLVKEYRFPDFRQALAFVNRAGEIAEREGHHPDIELGWGRVKLTLWTHSIGGLSENDFILAAKADRALPA